VAPLHQAFLDHALTVLDHRFGAVLSKTPRTLADGPLDKRARTAIAAMLPASHTARPVGGRLPVGVLPVAAGPAVLGALTAAGEIKTWRRGRRGIVATARKVAAAVTSARPMPFFVLARKVPSWPWLADLVDEIDRAGAGALWPAAFSFDPARPYSVVRVTPESPLRAKEGGGFLDGLLTIYEASVSQPAMLYLWLWAAIHADLPVHGMNFRLMCDAVEDLSDTAGLAAQFRSAANDIGRDQNTDVKLVLPRGLLHRPAPDRTPELGEPPPPDDASTPDTPRGRRVMLITLGGWVDEPDSWDESPWHGREHATRSGYGYRPGMGDDELLDSARLFWRWTPNSPTWTGIEYAVVAHQGVTRAVLRIGRTIGPFWGRWGFQAQIVDDPALKAELVGRQVPRRVDPITSITL
jgi:hypothetical protein